MLFMYALIVGAVGGIFSAIGKSMDSTPFTIMGGLVCLVSGIMFFANAFI